ncbi:hypothetical protein D3C72_2012660 [compost metagenome]
MKNFMTGSRTSDGFGVYGGSVRGASVIPFLIPRTCKGVQRPVTCASVLVEVL